MVTRISVVNMINGCLSRYLKWHDWCIMASKISVANGYLTEIKYIEIIKHLLLVSFWGWNNIHNNFNKNIQILLCVHRGGATVFRVGGPK